MKNKSILIILGALFCFNILAWLTVYDLRQNQFLEVTFFDVGQGDSIFIETPQGHQILIDGGPTSIILEKLAREMPFWDRTIDLVILSHPEKDHLFGLLEVLKRYRVQNILWTGIVRDTAEFKEWQKLIEEEKSNIFIAKAGEKISWLKNDSVQEKKIGVLFPLESLEGKEYKDSNDTSIVLRMIFGENSFLFTGDISKSGEKEILQKEVDIESDILKAGHHGSKTSSGPGFIEKVLPETAVISAGKENSYGHPHPETLATLEEYGIKIFRTDKDGDIKIISNSKTYAVSNFEN